jgi:oleate hydratase
MWRNIAAQDPAFGRPDKFCTHTDKSSYESSCVVTLDDKIPAYIERISQRDPFAFDGNIVTGGLVTVRDSPWLLSWNVEREPHFRDQPHDQLMIHAYGAYSLDRPGTYVKKPMKDCTGEEIVQEWLYHMGVPLDEIGPLAANSAVCHPCMMPYITAYFLPRRAGDRPQVVPERSANFGFLGQFAETPRDVIFTIEYSVRTAMEAVYSLLDIERGVPEPWGSQYDIRALLNSATVLRDGERVHLPAPIMGWLEQKSELGDLLRDYGWIGELDDPDLMTVAVRKSPPRGKTVL